MAVRPDMIVAVSVNVNVILKFKVRNDNRIHPVLPLQNWFVIFRRSDSSLLVIRMMRFAVTAWLFARSGSVLTTRDFAVMFKPVVFTGVADLSVGGCS